MRTNQKGFSAVEAILIIVIIGIISFAGWFVWNSQQQTNKALDESNAVSDSRTAATKAQPSTSDESDSDNSLVSVNVEGGHATVQAPKNWTVKNGDQKDQDTMFKTVKITSPDSKTTVTFARLGGLGGYCDPTDASTMTKLKITHLTNASDLSYIEYLQSDGKVYKMSVSPTAKATELQNGASVCDAYLDEVIKDYKGYTGNALFSISYEPFDAKLGDSTSTATPITATEYSAFVNSTDYQTAKAIILSLSYK